MMHKQNQQNTKHNPSREHAKDGQKPVLESRSFPRQHPHLDPVNKKQGQLRGEMRANHE